MSGCKIQIKYFKSTIRLILSGTDEGLLWAYFANVAPFWGPFRYSLLFEKHLCYINVMEPSIVLK